MSLIFKKKSRGEGHYGWKLMIVLYAKLNCVEKQLRKTYLISLKCSSDVTIGRSVVANVAQMVSMVISVL